MVSLSGIFYSAFCFFFFFSSRRRHTRYWRDWSSDVCSSDLGIGRWAAVLGGSMGGMRALEWAVAHPDRVAGLFFLASGAAVTADQLGTQTTQQTAVRVDPAWAGGDYLPDPGPVAGLGIARRIAHLTYRSGLELEERFGTEVQEDGRFAVASYLDHHADKLAGRFDPG